MQKLIVQYAVGDTYTYSATETVPVLFSSKEEFIIMLEEKALAQLAQRALLFVERNALFSKQQELSLQFQKSPVELSKKAKAHPHAAKGIAMTQPATEQIAAWTQVREAIQVMYQRIQTLETVILGGQGFPLDELVQDNFYCPPQVFTVDEFFTAGLTEPI